MSRQRLLLVEDPPPEVEGLEALLAHPRFRSLQRNSPNSWTAYASTDLPNSYRFGGGHNAADALRAALGLGAAPQRRRRVRL